MKCTPAFVPNIPVLFFYFPRPQQPEDQVDETQWAESDIRAKAKAYAEQAKIKMQSDIVNSGAKVDPEKFLPSNEEIENLFVAVSQRFDSVMFTTSNHNFSSYANNRDGLPCPLFTPGTCEEWN